MPSSRDAAGAPATHELGRGAHEVVLVVPLAREMALHEPVDAHDLTGPRALRGEHVERGVVEIGELAVRADERFLGGRVRRDRREHRARIARRARAGPPPRRPEWRPGRRPAAASRGAASSSARRYTVRNVDADDAAARVR